MKTIVILTIEHKKPVEDLLDKIAGRAYTLDGVDDVTCAFPELQALPVVDPDKQISFGARVDRKYRPEIAR